jgi:phage shock protein E
MSTERVAQTGHETLPDGQGCRRNPMKNICITFFVTCMFVACGWNEIDIQDIVIDENSTILDVRTEKEFNAGHLKNAINIPHTEIREKIKSQALGKEAKIIVYCRSGRRSSIAKSNLEKMGYKNVINAGSYEKLKKQE